MELAFDSRKPDVSVSFCKCIENTGAELVLLEDDADTDTSVLSEWRSLRHCDTDTCKTPGLPVKPPFSWETKPISNDP